MYNSDYIKEEIKFGEEKVFPNAGTPEKMIAMFAESLKNKNKLTTKCHRRKKQFSKSKCIKLLILMTRSRKKVTFLET